VGRTEVNDMTEIVIHLETDREKNEYNLKRKKFAGGELVCVPTGQLLFCVYKHRIPLEMVDGYLVEMKKRSRLSVLLKGKSAEEVNTIFSPAAHDEQIISVVLSPYGSTDTEADDYRDLLLRLLAEGSVSGEAAQRVAESIFFRLFMQNEEVNKAIKEHFPRWVKQVSNWDKLLPKVS
jgi:hypothetical protein